MLIPKTVAEGVKQAGGLRGLGRSFPSARRINRASATFQSLSDPIRLSILYALSVTPLCVCVMKSLVKISDSKLSYHLDNLKSAGLVSREREGKFLVYRITELGRMVLSACDRTGPAVTA
jgi:ArsR family transcriptional regulator